MINPRVYRVQLYEFWVTDWIDHCRLEVGSKGLCGVEFWAIKKCAEAKDHVAKMCMLRRMCGVARNDKI